jgi:dolichol-phosphate mannosyltransferase
MAQRPISIVVPTFCEAANIPILTRQLFDSLRAADVSAELIFVDDDSGDGSEEAVGELAAEYDVRIIVRKGQRGLSSAVLRGFAEAKHDILVCMDADLSHPPESVPAVVAPVAAGEADFAIGSRYVAGGRTKDDWGLLRWINSKGATLMARPLTAVRDPMAGFFCIPRSVLRRAEQAGLNPIGYKVALEIMIKARCRSVREIPIEFADRLHGESKLTLRQQLQYIRHLMRLYRFRWPVLAPAIATVVLIAILFIVSKVLGVGGS